MEERARLEIIGTRLHIFFNDEQWSIEGRSAGSTSITPGSFWFEGTIIKYVDYYGTLREIDTDIVGYNVGNRLEGYFSAAREYWIWYIYGGAQRGLTHQDHGNHGDETYHANQAAHQDSQHLDQPEHEDHADGLWSYPSHLDYNAHSDQGYQDHSDYVDTHVNHSDYSDNSAVYTDHNDHLDDHANYSDYADTGPHTDHLDHNNTHSDHNDYADAGVYNNHVDHSNSHSDAGPGHANSHQDHDDHTDHQDTPWMDVW